VLSRRAQAAVGWAALLVIFLSVVPAGANLHVAWLALSIAVLALFFCQLVIDAFDGTGSVVREGLWLPALGLLAAFVWARLQFSTQLPDSLENEAWSWVDLPGMIAVDPSHGQHVLTRLIAYTMIFWIAMRAAMDDGRAASFIKAIALWSTLVAGYGVLVMATGRDWLAGSEAPNNLSATFVNRNSYATYAGFGLAANLAALWLLVEKASGERRDARGVLRDVLEAVVSGGWIYLFGAFVVGNALFLTVSRAGILSGAVGVFVMTVALAMGSRNRAGITSWPVVAAVGAVAIYAAFPVAETFLACFVDFAPEEPRFNIYPLVLAAMADSPLLGYGLGGFQDAFRSHMPAELAVSEWDMAHSTYLENVLEFGMPAGILFYGSLAFVLWRILRGTRERGRRVAAPAFALAVGLIGALHSLVDFSLQMPATAALYAFVLGLGWAQSFPRRFRSPPRED